MPAARPLLTALALLLAGMVLAIGGALAVRSARQFERAALVLPGRVVALNAGGSHPEIGFTTPEGQQRSFPQGGLISGYAVGQPVEVLYDPSGRFDPAVRSRAALYGFPGLTLAVGIGLSLAGLITWAGSRPQRAQTER